MYRVYIYISMYIAFKITPVIDRYWGQCPRDAQSCSSCVLLVGLSDDKAPRLVRPKRFYHTKSTLEVVHVSFGFRVPLWVVWRTVLFYEFPLCSSQEFQYATLPRLYTSSKPIYPGVTTGPHCETLVQRVLLRQVDLVVLAAWTRVAWHTSHPPICKFVKVMRRNNMLGVAQQGVPFVGVPIIRSTCFDVNAQ